MYYTGIMYLKIGSGKMKITEVCPFCNSKFPLDVLVCECGAYRVTEDNYHKSLKQILKEHGKN